MSSSRKKADGSRLSISGFPLAPCRPEHRRRVLLTSALPSIIPFSPAQLASPHRSLLRGTVQAAHLPHATSRAPAAMAEQVTREQLASVFALPLSAAAEALGIGTTTLKRACRLHDVKRWPYRKIKSIDTKIEMLESQLKACTDPAQIAHMNIDLQYLRNQRSLVFRVPNAALSSITKTGSTVVRPRSELPRARSRAEDEIDVPEEDLMHRAKRPRYEHTGSGHTEQQYAHTSVHYGGASIEWQTRAQIPTYTASATSGAREDVPPEAAVVSGEGAAGCSGAHSGSPLSMYQPLVHPSAPLPRVDRNSMREAWPYSQHREFAIRTTDERASLAGARLEGDTAEDRSRAMQAGVVSSRGAPEGRDYSMPSSPLSAGRPYSLSGGAGDLGPGGDLFGAVDSVQRMSAVPQEAMARAERRYSAQQSNVSMQPGSSAVEDAPTAAPREDGCGQDDGDGSPGGGQQIVLPRVQFDASEEQKLQVLEPC